MARDFATAFYKSQAWQDCRDSYISSRIAIDGGLCERCHDKPGYIVHHKKHLDPVNIKDPYVALSHDNLEYVCLDCHNFEHSGGAALICSFDENGRPVAR